MNIQKSMIVLSALLLSGLTHAQSTRRNALTLDQVRALTKNQNPVIRISCDFINQDRQAQLDALDPNLRDHYTITAQAFVQSYTVAPETRVAKVTNINDFNEGHRSILLVDDGSGQGSKVSSYNLSFEFGANLETDIPPHASLTDICEAMALH